MKTQYENKWFLTISCLLTISILFCNCGNVGNGIIGKWKPIKLIMNGKQQPVNDPNEIMEFFSDKTVMMPKVGLRKWTKLNDGRIKIDYPEIGTAMFGSLQGGILTITFAMGGEKAVITLKKKN